MKNTEHEMQDELRPEYDLTQLRVRKLGPKRSKFGNFVQLAPDVEKVFPNSEKKYFLTQRPSMRPCVF